MGMTLRDELERIRAERGWSLRRMAEELLVSEPTYRHYIAGHNRAGRKVLGGVALAFPFLNVAYYAAQDIRQTAAEAATARSVARGGAHEGNHTSTSGKSRQSANTIRGEQ